jgi:hypothetical protein
MKNKIPLISFYAVSAVLVVFGYTYMNSVSDITLLQRTDVSRAESIAKKTYSIDSPAQLVTNIDGDVTTGLKNEGTAWIGTGRQQTSGVVFQFKDIVIPQEVKLVNATLVFPEATKSTTPLSVLFFAEKSIASIPVKTLSDFESLPLTQSFLFYEIKDSVSSGTSFEIEGLTDII